MNNSLASVKLNTKLSHDISNLRRVSEQKNTVIARIKR